MKIKWKLRFQNKAVLTALIATVATFVHQVLAIFEITPPVSESEIIECAGLVLNLLVALGVLTDPTTAGVNDSAQALEYEKPKE
jgi:phi LC3 family holin